MSELEALYRTAQLSCARGVSTVDFEGAFVELLTYIEQHPECREEAEALFVEDMVADSTEWELISFCMHALRWEAIEDKARALMDGASDPRNRRVFELIVESFSDDWDGRDMYSYPFGRGPIPIANLGEFNLELCHELRDRIGNAALAAAESDEELVELVRAQFEPGAPEGIEAFCEPFLRSSADSIAPAPPQGRRTRGGRPVRDRGPKRPPEVSHARWFVHAVLGFADLPRKKREALRDAALRDLAELEALIVSYEALPAVKSYRDGDRPRAAEQRMHVDFYRRCLNERAAICRYITSGVDDEAIAQSDVLHAMRSWLFSASGVGRPDPYRLRSWLGREYLDFKKINRWRHRVLASAPNAPASEAHRLSELYVLDRREFYRQLASYRPVARCFDDIDLASGKVPRLKQRASIFAELRSLYDASHWLGFYALALPQVEGLFAEMGELAEKKRARSHSALPAKVRFIRTYAATHAHNLDYFEYSLPLERNQFSHSGLVAEPDLRALEILHDLAYVCRVYMEIDSPVIELVHLLHDHDHDHHDKIRRWDRIFDLVTKVTEVNQLDEVREPLQTFLRRHFPDDAAKGAEADELAKMLSEMAGYTRDTLRDRARERLGIELDLGVKKKTREVVENAGRILDLIEEIDVLDPDFFAASMLRRIMEGLRDHGEFPADACAKIKDALIEAERETLTNLDSIITLGDRARGL